MIKKSVSKIWVQKYVGKTHLHGIYAVLMSKYICTFDRMRMKIEIVKMYFKP